MIGESGCFGQGTSTERIGTAEEAAAAVSAIVEDTADPAAADPTAVTVKLAVTCDALRQRVRILTWAVALLALVVIMKEIE